MKSSFIKKAASAAAAMAIALSSVITNASAEREILGYMGDVNHDNTVSVADLVALDGYLIGGGQLGEDCAYNADMNFDGRVNVGDLIILRSYLAGSRPVDVIYGEEITTTTTTAEVTTTTTATTTETTTTTTAEADFINAAVDDVEGYLPSQGTGNLVIFYVDFPDCRYSYDPTAEQVREIAFGEEDTSDRNYPFDSMHAFYQRSSKGALDLEGKVFRYTAKNNQATYDNDKDALVKECYAAFDAEYDFSQFDGDNDGHIDATLLTVPTAAGDDAWWPCAGPSGLSDNYYVKYDGKMIGHLITGNAQIESATDYKNFNSSYLHEMGHCMGLPDYYLYTGTDTEGLHGIAGLELMDMDVNTALEFCKEMKTVKPRLEILRDLGLGYLTLGEETPGLSGGEAQRLKLASEMGRQQDDSVFVFDEPTIGLHPKDVETLLTVFQTLIDHGATVIVIEHDLDVIRSADYIIDMGPGGGEDGGRIVATGTPEVVRNCGDSITGKYI